jgi:hypothetical protein
MTWVPAVLEKDRRPGMKEVAQRIRAAGILCWGILLGFISAFFVFDLALLQGATTARALAMVRYWLWHILAWAS